MVTVLSTIGWILFVSIWVYRYSYKQRLKMIPNNTYEYYRKDRKMNYTSAFLATMVLIISIISLFL